MRLDLWKMDREKKREGKNFQVWTTLTRRRCRNRIRPICPPASAFPIAALGKEWLALPVASALSLQTCCSARGHFPKAPVDQQFGTEYYDETSIKGILTLGLRQADNATLELGPYQDEPSATQPPRPTMTRPDMYEPSLAASHLKSATTAKKAEGESRTSEEVLGCRHRFTRSRRTTTSTGQDAPFSGRQRSFISAHRLVATARRRSCGNLRVCRGVGEERQIRDGGVGCDVCLNMMLLVHLEEHCLTTYPCSTRWPLSPEQGLRPRRPRPGCLPGHRQRDHWLSPASWP